MKHDWVRAAVIWITLLGTISDSGTATSQQWQQTGDWHWRRSFREFFGRGVRGWRYKEYGRRAKGKGRPN
jgi:hypothetical protein